MDQYPPYIPVFSPETGPRAEKLRRLVWIMYILLACGLCTGSSGELCACTEERLCL